MWTRSHQYLQLHMKQGTEHGRDIGQIRFDIKTRNATIHDGLLNCHIFLAKPIITSFFLRSKVISDDMINCRKKWLLSSH